jgi:hypothetical protein
MKRTFLMSICIGAVALGGACSRGNTPQDNKTDDNKPNIVDLATHPAAPGSISAVTVDGCLSASGDRFMLASLDKDSTKTTVYQLMNADDQLRNFVGREVRVTGQAQATQASTETREVTPPAPAATSGTANVQPKVSTVEDTKLDVRKLTVASVAPTGDSCPR